MSQWLKKKIDISDDEESEEYSSEEEEETPKKNTWLKKNISDSEEESEEEGSEEESDEEEEKPQKRPTYQNEDEEDVPAVSDEQKRLQERRNRWLKKDGSDSESDSDLDSDLDEDEDEKPRRRSRFDSDDEEEDDTKRVVRSAKDKSIQHLNDLQFKVETKISANSWKDIEDELKNVMKAVEKVQKLQIPSYTESDFVPKSYIRFVANLEDSAERAFKNRAKITTEHAKALGSVRGKLRKLNAPFKQPISNYRKDPDGYVDHDEEDSDVEEQDAAESWFDKSQAAQDQLTKVQQPTDEWSDVVGNKGKTNKKKTDDDKKTGQNEAPAQRKKPVAPKKKTAPAKTGRDRVITEDNLEERLTEMKHERGYKGTNSADQLLELEKYLKIAEQPSKTLLVLEMIVNTLLDLGTPHADFLPVDTWKVAICNFARVLYLMKNNSGLQFPNLVILFERLDNEFIKSLQFIDPHTQDYVNRLKDEMLVLDIGERVFELCGPSSQAAVAVRLIEHLYYRKQDDHERLIKKQRELVPQILSEMSKTWISKGESVAVTFDRPSVISEDLHSILIRLSNLVFAENAAQSNTLQVLQNTKCVVSLIYHLALRGDWERASELVLRTRIGESINQMAERDISVMIGYNRAICQLGICAFRCGLITEAHHLLSEICSSGKTKELLAQALTVNRHADKTKKVDTEKIERSRLVLFHKHINLDLLEGVHLISAMILEVPNMAQRSFTKRKVISKSLRRALEFYDRQVFTGPPENTKEHIIVAAKTLTLGDWENCFAHLIALEDMWNLMIDSEKVKAMLAERIKVEAMRTYLFSYGHHYDTIAVNHLSTMFSLEERLVHGIVSKMMTNEELYAAWDQPTNSFKLYRSEPTKLQQLALQLSETTTAYVDWNERMYEAKSQGGSLLSTSKDYDQKKKKTAASGKPTSTKPSTASTASKTAKKGPTQTQTKPRTTKAN